MMNHLVVGLLFAMAAIAAAPLFYVSAFLACMLQ